MWSQVFVAFRNRPFGRVLLVMWLVLLLTTAAIFVIPAVRPAIPYVSGYAFVLVILSFIYGASVLVRTMIGSIREK